MTRTEDFNGDKGNQRSRKPAILIIDDSPENLDVLKDTLKGEFTVQPTMDGQIGLRIANTVPRPDLVLLDIMMPGIDGYEVLRQLRDNPETQDIPVLFVTAVTDVQGELFGLELGAVDYITKPFNPAVVKARIRTHLALRDARLRIAQQNEALQYERELIERCLERMREAPDFEERHLRFLASPLERSNGDLLLSATTAHGRHWVLFGDITGHGLPAAMAAPLISYIFYTAAHNGTGSSEALAEINSMMHQQLPAELFMTACLVDIAADRKSFFAWNAAMPPALLMSEGEVLQKIEPSRMLPLGISHMLDIEANRVCVDVSRPCNLFMHSDGVADVENAAGEPFGSYRLELFLAELQKHGMEPQALLPRLSSFRGNAEFEDDIGLVEIDLG